MIDGQDFLDYVSATTQHQTNVKNPLMGYIDYEFDVSMYPTEWPRVIIDGQGLSERTYPCMSSYFPQPGDRVVLLPVGSGHVVLGAVLDNPTPRLLPGTLVFRAHSQQNQTVNSGSANAVAVLWDNVTLDLLGGWAGDLGPGWDDLRSRYTPTVPGWYTFRGAVTWSSAGEAIGDNFYRSANWSINGSVPSPGAGRNSPVNQNHVTNARTISYYMNGSSDYIELVASQFTDGTSLNLQINTFAPNIEVTYAGPGSLNEQFPSVE